MKKVFIVLNIICTICFSSLFTFYKDFYKTVDQISGDIITQDIDEQLVLLKEYDSRDKVYLNSLPYQNEFVTKVKINEYSLPITNDSIKGGDIFLKNSCIGDYKVTYDLRIMEIYNDHVIVENLEETYLEISYMPHYKIDNFDNFTFTLKYIADNPRMVKKDCYFDTVKGMYVIKLTIANNGKILSYSTARVTISYGMTIEGLYINQKYVYQDDDGTFVYKVINLKGTEYYSKIYIDIIDSYNDYFKIQGEINGNNVIVRL
ncbi:MAG: hypothetical protein ACI311_06650 [Bacilli bacterium]